MYTPIVKSFFFLLLIGIMAACNSGDETEAGKSFHVPEGLNNREEIRFRQYAVQGRLLYVQHCSNCHQDDGSGLSRLIPPLAKADYLMQNPQKAACIIKCGHEGSMVVNGTEYNQPMPANPQLKDIEIAEITTYILNAWGNKGDFIDVKQAQLWLKNCEVKN